MRLSRRELLQRGGGAGLVVVTGGGLLAACGSDTTGAADGGPPVRGGTLRVGLQGGGAADGLDAHNPLSNLDEARLSALYDPLIRMGDDSKPKFALAESAEPNKDATEWTIRIRKGVVTHNGKPFGARDVLYNFQRIVKNQFQALSLFPTINVRASEVLDPHTVRLNFDQPFSTLVSALSVHWIVYMVPEGYDPKKPDGTGPFKLTSFEPGRQSEMVRFKEYWDQPKPYLDRLVLIDTPEETAQVNGLQSGQFDAVDLLGAGSIAALKGSDSKLVISDESAAFSTWAMRVDGPPFDDVRVRTAFKLIFDRPAFLKTVFGGHGTIANDIASKYDVNYDPNLVPQREQDIEQAKSLLAAAGRSDLSVTLYAPPIAPAQGAAAEAFVPMAAEAGVQVKVVKPTVTDFYANSYGKVAFSGSYYSTLPYLSYVGYSSLSTSPYNDTGFSNPHYDQLYKEATSTLDEDKQRDLVHEMMTIDYNEGGTGIPYNVPIIDAVAPNVYGVIPTLTGWPLRNFQFQEFWIKE